MNQELYQYYILDRTHRGLRRSLDRDLAREYSEAGLSFEERMTRRFELLTSLETPIIHPREQIVLLRTVQNLPDVLTEGEWEEQRAQYHIHELGYVSNLCPNYAETIAQGLLERRENATPAQVRMIDAILDLCDRYREEAARMGREDLVEILTRIPRNGAQTLREALQFFRILHYSLWLEGDYHNTVGRFDQYMLPYLNRDIAEGRLNRESALELVEDFFLSFNKDSDLYVGVQQGDNGQSMVLGGRLPDGSDGFNLLSELCLEASRNLRLIDPKINLRVSKNTPLSVYEKGTELTKVGLGFPQYSNDDVVIDGLIRMGYEPQDAVNYLVAACWEFIIPGVGDDIANIGAVNLPMLADRAIRAYLPHGERFEGLVDAFRAEVSAECDRITGEEKPVWFVPSPFMDLLRDGRKYRNFGLHGCGAAVAADELAAVGRYVFEEKTVTPERLIEAMDHNFENDPELLHLLRFEAPKAGTGDANGTAALGIVLDAFADALEGKKNLYGGVWRAGTGSAMFYLWYARELGATADGRRAGEPFGTNFSPSLFAKIPGPVTVIDAFTERPMERNMNGGPLTLEFAGRVFHDPESMRKVAKLIQYFVQRGGHQLQLNAVDPDTMRRAQKDPDSYRQLVVRIWGWSAYFVELDRDFQDHVLARQEYVV